MKKPRAKRDSRYKRVIFSLPAPLVEELREHARIVRGGNKSGFVADALRAYIDGLRKRRHTARLRVGYAAAAEQSLTMAKEWDGPADEAWAQLDELEAKSRRRRRR